RFDTDPPVRLIGDPFHPNLVSLAERVPRRIGAGIGQYLLVRRRQGTRAARERGHQDHCECEAQLHFATPGSHRTSAGKAMIAARWRKSLSRKGMMPRKIAPIGISF